MSSSPTKKDNDQHPERRLRKRLSHDCTGTREKSPSDVGSSDGGSAAASASPSHKPLGQSDNHDSSVSAAHPSSAAKNTASTGTADPSAPADEASHLATVRKLDREYAALDAMEAELLRALQEAKDDEMRIRQAMQLSSETLAERRDREAAERDRAAVERLESALMADDDSDSEDEVADMDVDEGEKKTKKGSGHDEGDKVALESLEHALMADADSSSEEGDAAKSGGMVFI
mmetsp:Transcript_23402/g.51822  ORF Transcript_23402/g.51822 Transcript_23402/m.51822 type:complete len:232 (-) Transcript_23402:113-808(-)